MSTPNHNGFVREHRYALPTEAEIPAEVEPIFEWGPDDEEWNTKTSPLTQETAPSIDSLFTLSGDRFQQVVDEYKTAVGIPLERLSFHALTALLFAVKAEIQDRIETM